jgi:hypothetical protein
MPKNKGKGGKNRRRGKNDNEENKRELEFKEDGQGACERVSGGVMRDRTGCGLTMARAVDPQSTRRWCACSATAAWRRTALTV